MQDSVGRLISRLVIAEENISELEYAVKLSKMKIKQNRTLILTSGHISNHLA